MFFRCVEDKMTASDFQNNPAAVNAAVDQLEKEQGAGNTLPENASGYAPVYTVSEILRDNISWIMHSGKFTAEQKHAALAIAYCKTKQMGGFMQYCPNCKKPVSFHYSSCNNRNCPRCQYPAQLRWIALRKSEVIPGTQYYHIILTVPHLLNDLITANRKPLLDLLFKCTSGSIITLCRDPKTLGATPGIVTTLHTWASDLTLHYHTHSIVSGGGLNAEGTYINLKDLRKEQAEARAAAKGQTDDTADVANADKTYDYLFPEAKLNTLFRDKYMDGLKKLYHARKLVLPESLAYLSDPFEWSGFCTKLYQTNWVGKIVKTSADAETGVGTLAEYCSRLPGQNTTFTQTRVVTEAEDALTNGGVNDTQLDQKPESLSDAFEYLGRYAFHAGISDSRIQSYDPEKAVVSFNARDPQNKTIDRLVTYPVYRFISLFLSHILPKGFTRIRFSGFLSCGQRSKRLESIFRQVCQKSYTVSPIKGLKGIQLLKALFPNSSFGVCPICNTPTTPIAFGSAVNRAKFYKPKQRCNSRGQPAC